MCGRCGIEKFYEAAKKLSRVWFDGEERTELTEKLEYYILTGGLYGTESNAIAIKQVKSGGKMGYALSRIWLPYSKLSELYPSLRKQKWLLPFYQIRRWFAVLMRGRLRHSVKELKTNSAVTNDNAKNIEDILSILEL